MYFTGHPCKRGHVACRYTANYQCVTCARLDRAKYRKKATQKQQRLLGEPIPQTVPKPFPAQQPPLGLMEAFRRYLIRKLS